MAVSFKPMAGRLIPPTLVESALVEKAAASPDCPYALENGFFDEEEEEDFREQASLREGRARGLPGDLLLPVSSLSSSDWILKST
ncbi:Protein FAM89A [Fukomys damarensis]|uniref:Protein FAM89A n=1 Tax=Fukomys damarensis TaxID=885580 RepID=A0A091DT40_FUKDA|nr:Protein FAM89A [Fukomys damarensis]